MARVLKVYTLYTDEATMRLIISRLVEHSFSFSYTGEFLYSNTPWTSFLQAFCNDITAPITTDCERWSDGCLSFEGEDTDEQIEFFSGDEKIGVVKASPFYYTKVKRFLSKLCIAAADKFNASFHTL